MLRKRYIFLKYYIKSKFLKKKVSPDKIRKYLKNRIVVANNRVQTAEEINNHIGDMVLSGEPFFVGRFGANELSAIKTFDFELKSKYGIVMEYLCRGAGFFPNVEVKGKIFKDLMLALIPTANVMGIWMLPFEEYYLNSYGSEQLKTTYLFDLEPWSNPGKPWSAALKGKKVLVIHPFKETIEKQYKKRERIFPGTDILPEFKLITLKAVQTIAGEKDNRFLTWFDALEWMYQEALKIDFDIAIIGCGAYGFPLAAKLKQAGKQSIHLGGATQLLFGIKGKRWEENKIFAYIQKFFNDAWVYPSEEEKPEGASRVEDGCYW